MPVDKEKIKKAVDSFEEDNFVDSEDIIKQELKKAKNNHLKKELELQNDIEKVESEEEEKEE